MFNRASKTVLAPAQLIAAALAISALAAGCRQPEAASSGARRPLLPAAVDGGTRGRRRAGPGPRADRRDPRGDQGGDTSQLAVSPEDGQFLRMLVASTGRKRALEIGAAQGYSAIWIGMGLRDTGGTLVTIEYDPVRAKEAAANVKRAGLDDIVTVIGGDAFLEIPKLTGTFDCVFVDAWKRDYIKFFDITYPRLDDGGLFLGHNVINKKSEMSDFLDRIATHPDLFTSIVAPGGEGVSISYKRRPRSRDDA